MQDTHNTPLNVANHVWDGRINGELADFDEFCAVMNEISDSVERAI